ncbi:uncharacterized protein LOC143604510, partial [Bidens hawaiensis]|uniref:uncharacterized protein LOC143604510 n=1 Tax=Bidens hawaiensis TaxID=980011 RepID=UPI00404B00CA
MLNFLFAKNKTGFVDGTIKKPDQGSPNLMAWLRCDAMIKGWLNMAMEKEIRTSVKYAATAQGMWTDMKERFGKASAPRAYELKQSLSTTKQEGKQLTDLRDKERLYEFLLGFVDAEFETIRTQILAMQPIPSLMSAFQLMKDDEQQRAISGGKRLVHEPAAFQAHVPSKRDQGQSLNRPKLRDGKRGVGEQVEHCTLCGRDGHKKDECFKRIGYPEWWP